MDNYYTSPALFSALKQVGFGACGTVRINRWGMPKQVMAAKLKKGKMTSSEVKKGMLALKWQDMRPVNMLSTIHDNSRVTNSRRTRLAAGGIKEVKKPTIVDRYSTYMGGVDKGDQLMSYGFSYRTVKWWRRAFFHLFENAIVNAYILYRLSTQPGHMLDHKQFRIELAKQLLGDADGHTNPPSHRLNAVPPVARLTERRFIEKVPPLYKWKDLTTCVCCAEIKAAWARPQHINASSVSYLCVSFLALNYTTLK